MGGPSLSVPGATCFYNPLYKSKCHTTPTSDSSPSSPTVTSYTPSDSPSNGPTLTLKTASPTFPPTKGKACVKANKYSKSCGTKMGSENCCNGLVCNIYYKKCVKEQFKLCAGPNSFSKQCGSRWGKAAPH